MATDASLNIVFVFMVVIVVYVLSLSYNGSSYHHRKPLRKPQGTPHFAKANHERINSKDTCNDKGSLFEWRSKKAKENFCTTEELTLGAQCKTLQKMLQDGETSGRAQLQGIVLGYKGNPGKNGLGDRIIGIVGMTVLAMGLGRPLRISVKEDTFNFTSLVANPGVVPWNLKWNDFGNLKKMQQKEKKDFLYTERRPSELSLSSAQTQNKTIFIAGMGGDHIADVKWLTEKLSTTNSSVTAELAEEFLQHEWTDDTLSYCIIRALLQPHETILQQLDRELQQVPSSDSISFATTVNNERGIAPNLFIIGLHARFSGGKVEKHAPLRMSPEEVTNQIKCTNDMMLSWVLQVGNSSSSSKDKRIVLIIASDLPSKMFEEVKMYYKQQQVIDSLLYPLQIVHATVGVAKHIKHDTSYESVLRLWLDWFLLSQSVACSFGRSGFPRTACMASKRRVLAHGVMQEGAKQSCSHWT
eukprot:m.52271 g.52271  ORF g.52271 m.52271 type:complete len:470 (-) comp10781_c1_seq1:310-1719(-)